MRTISASTAISRLRKMDVLPQKQKSSSEADDLDGLTELRNGVARLGTDNVDDYLATFVATMDKLLQHLRQEADSFWEAWSDTVRMIQDDRADRLQKYVRLRMNQARHRLRTRIAHLPEAAVDGVEQAVSERGLTVVEVGPARALFQTLSRCPACRREAAVLFLAVGDSPLFDLELKTEGLLCGLCGFRLSSAEEVEAAGLPTVLQHPRRVAEPLQLRRRGEPQPAGDRPRVGAAPAGPAHCRCHALG
ncbi:hypothetical protein [Streptomyces sp. NPDC087859]|uniref:hypothetical protein n=1 Tax=Streptomyces sp. NPDC087859 TaxID=3365812 RepID=UPI00382B3FE4